MDFPGSLKELVSIKIASALCSHDEIWELMSKMRKAECEGVEWTLLEDIWNKLQSRVSEMLKTSLPPPLQRNVMKYLRSLRNEIAMWHYDHSKVFNADIDYRRYLQWDPDGTINEIKTAKHLVSVPHIDIKHRFLLAAHYRLREDIVPIWNEMSGVDRVNVNKYYSTLFFQDWMKGIAVCDDWTPRYRKISFSDFLKRKNFDSRLQIAIRIVSFRENLRIKLEERAYMKPIVRPLWLISKDYRFFWDTREIRSTVYLCYVLLQYLDLSIEDSQSDGIKELLEGLFKGNKFPAVLEYILRQILTPWTCYIDYIELLRQLWVNCSSKQRLLIASKKNFNLLKLLIDPEESKRSSKQMLYERYRTVTLFSNMNHKFFNETRIYKNFP